MCSVSCFAQASQSFNSGGTADFNFGTTFVNSYSTVNVQEGVFPICINISGLGETSKDIKVFPVPFKEEFMIKTDGSQHQFVIYSVTGQAIKGGQTNTHEFNVKLDASPGIFILRIYSLTKGSWYAYKIEKIN